MNQPKHHIRRRHHALGRLSSLTTGAAFAGLAATAGFGVLAAATWSGDPTATSAADLKGGQTGGSGATGGSGRTGQVYGTQPGDAFGALPNGGSSGTTRVRAAQPGTRSHATTGGSG